MIFQQFFHKSWSVKTKSLWGFTHLHISRCICHTPKHSWSYPSTNSTCYMWCVGKTWCIIRHFSTQFHIYHMWLCNNIYWNHVELVRIHHIDIHTAHISTCNNVSSTIPPSRTPSHDLKVLLGFDSESRPSSALGPQNRRSSCAAWMPFFFFLNDP